MDITNETVFQIIQQCPHLSAIEVKHCNNVDQVQLTKLMESVGLLEKVKLTIM